MPWQMTKKYHCLYDHLKPVQLSTYGPKSVSTGIPKIITFFVKYGFTLFANYTQPECLLCSYFSTNNNWVRIMESVSMCTWMCTCVCVRQGNSVNAAAGATCSQNFYQSTSSAHTVLYERLSQHIYIREYSVLNVCLHAEN